MVNAVRMNEHVEDTVSLFSGADLHHGRRVAVILVREVYAMAKERFTGCVSDLPSICNFKPIEYLRDKRDGTIFGVVFKWNTEAARGFSRPTDAPQIVVAFRGTVLKCESGIKDIILDCSILFKSLHKSSRVLSAFEAVKRNIDKYGADKVWIAGHSLGAAIGLLVGRKFAVENGHYLQAHLFNPPFVSPKEFIPCEPVKRGLHVGKAILTAALAVSSGNQSKLSENAKVFCCLAPWVPTLYVNESDVICSGYRTFFHKQESMRLHGAGYVADLAAQNSFTGLLFSAFGKEDTAALHLIPSAMLVVNLAKTEDRKESHSIVQWQSDNIKMEYKTYKLIELG